MLLQRLWKRATIGAAGEVCAEEERCYFNSAGAARRFAARMVSRSQQAMRHLYALKRLARRFSAEELRGLSPDASNKWLALVRTHARAFRQEIAELRQELKPIFSPTASGDSLPDGPQVYDTAGVAQAIERLFELGSANDRVVLSAFTTSLRVAPTPPRSRRHSSGNRCKPPRH
jgi:hypothetical protein